MQHSNVIEWLGSVADDPYAFVMGAFPWMEPETTLADEPGPDVWQQAQLKRIRDAIADAPDKREVIVKEAIASGHGIGKSCEVSWLILWAFSTSADTRGVVTANTENQLKTKTWSELGKWFNLFIAKDNFLLEATSLRSRDPSRERTWRIDQVPWSEKNTEAFAGMHNKGRRILMLFDEGSAIPDKIYEVAQGALTDAGTQIFWFVYGNPTRNTGRFRELFDPASPHAHGWTTHAIDSRDVRVTNKVEIAEAIAAYGDDSDWVRVRVLGQFPRIGEMEFISAADVDAAMAREPLCDRTDPLALGVDVARYGLNASVLYFRKGRDAATFPRRRYQGLSTVELASRVVSAHAEFRPDGIFVDGVGVGGGVVDQLRAGGLHCEDVQAGGKDDVRGYPTGNAGERYANKRAAMWGAMRQWIKTGCLPKDPDLRQQLISVNYTFNPRGEIVLESKKDMESRGAKSPDDADALALTFAYPLQVSEFAGGPHQTRRAAVAEYEYDPMESAA